jgi:hypothetical protein
MEYVIGGIVVLVLWFFSTSKRNLRNAKGQIAREAAIPWLHKNNVEPGQVFLAFYDDQRLVSNTGASILVGGGKNKAGKFVGIVVEVLPEKGVVAGGFLEPDGISLRHASASQNAITSNRTLIDVMMEMAVNHRSALSSREPRK